jgi:hypothetical protein
MTDAPPARLKCEPGISFNEERWFSLVPKPYAFWDGDGTNLVINTGVKFTDDSGGQWLNLQLDFTIPPVLHWLVAPIFDFLDRRAER